MGGAFDVAEHGRARRLRFVLLDTRAYLRGGAQADRGRRADPHSGPGGPQFHNRDEVGVPTRCGTAGRLRQQLHAAGVAIDLGLNDNFPTDLPKELRATFGLPTNPWMN